MGRPRSSIASFEQHGKRIAVIENEFGEVGVDHQLVIGAEEEIFETNNGCICCTVRGDLLRILGQPLKRRDRFDYVIVETTGMADPGPVAQTFFLDDDLKQQFALDAIVTLVDALHFEKHLDEMDEPGEQVAFADVILLNKTDLVPADALERIERRVRAINATAKIFRTRNADLPIDKVLNVGAASTSTARWRSMPRSSSRAHPFEAASVYQLPAGEHVLRTGAGVGGARARARASGPAAAMIMGTTTRPTATMVTATSIMTTTRTRTTDTRPAAMPRRCHRMPRTTTWVTRTTITTTTIPATITAMVSAWSCCRRPPRPRGRPAQQVDARGARLRR
ncbi:MAG: GTP-binding protein [Steroidobacteraceae bacterium]